MNPRTLFEALMRANGYEDFSLNPHGRYNNNSIQTRWKYFLLGWEMRATHEKEV